MCLLTQRVDITNVIKEKLLKKNCVSQNLRKLGKSETFLICACHFLRFIKFLIENDTRSNFCVFNN